MKAMVFCRADQRHHEMELAAGYTTAKTIFGQHLVVEEAAFEDPAGYRRRGGREYGLDAGAAARAGLGRFVEGGRVKPLAGEPCSGPG